MTRLVRGVLLALVCAVACCTPLEPTVNTAVAAAPDEKLPEQNELRTCNADADCIAVSAGCCGCTAGGMNTPINSKYESAWRRALAQRCVDIVCPAVMSDDPSCHSKPQCVDGQCVLH
jgi:hypothetical protein